MSIWTHINCSIRVDGGPLFKAAGIDDIDLLSGSEGPLKFQIWKNPSESSVASHTVNIFGDLRDYNDDDSVEKWFLKLLNKYPMFRGAVCEIDNENNKHIIILHAQQTFGKRNIEIIINKLIVNKAN